MPKELSSKVKNEINIFDNLSQSEITLYYRKPKSSEYIQYQSAIVQNMVSKKSPEEAQKIQIEWVSKLLVGFKKGSFVLDGAEISSEKEDENYYEDWKELLKEEEAPILLAVARVALGEPNYIVKEQTLPFYGN